MNLDGQRESDNVDDLRGQSGGGTQRVLFGGGIGTIVIAVVALLMGQNPLQLISQVNSIAPQTEQVDNPQLKAQEAGTELMVRKILGNIEDVWSKLFTSMGGQYEKPRLELFNEGVQSACGNASTSSGPFYCPGDQKVYIDLAFYEELKNRFHVTGDFAMAYVIAHEIGHHVQYLLGTSSKVSQLENQTNEVNANKLSVNLELQADFYAGVWAHHAQNMSNIIQPGDIQAAINAASAVGDDNLQKQAQGYVVPDAFTHGTSAQRMYWFNKGYQTGDMKQGDTFNNSK